MKLDNTTIREAVALWCEDQNACIQSFGHISNWDTSHVTDMSKLFYEKRNFNENIDSWDVSNVTNMRNMFKSANAFNQPIGSWDVSNVIDMGGMFSGAEAFNQAIGFWDVSNVTEIDEMFFIAKAFDQPIGSWNVSKVINMSFMFAHAYSFNQPIDSWNVSNVTEMANMFFIATAFNQPIGSWDVSKVTDMGNMFEKATAFNQPLGSWDMCNVTDMSKMFLEATAFNPRNSPGSEIRRSRSTDSDTVLTNKDFKYEIENFIKKEKVENFELTINIAKWYGYTPYKYICKFDGYNFKANISHVCKWGDCEHNYEHINELLNDIKDYEIEELHKYLDIEIIPEDDGFELEFIEWEEGTPEEFIEKIEEEWDVFNIMDNGYEEEIFDIIYKEGAIIDGIRILLSNDDSTFELSWKY